MQNFVAISKKMPEISPDAPRKSGPKFTKNFRGCYPLRPPIMPSFIEIGQTSLEIGVVRKKKFSHTHTYIQYMWHTHGILTTWVALRSMREARLKTWAGDNSGAPWNRSVRAVIFSAIALLNGAIVDCSRTCSQCPGSIVSPFARDSTVGAVVQLNIAFVDSIQGRLKWPAFCAHDGWPTRDIVWCYIRTRISQFRPSVDRTVRQTQFYTNLVLSFTPDSQQSWQWVCNFVL